MRGGRAAAGEALQHAAHDALANREGLHAERRNTEVDGVADTRLDAGRDLPGDFAQDAVVGACQVRAAREDVDDAVAESPRDLRQEGVADPVPGQRAIRIGRVLNPAPAVRVEPADQLDTAEIDERPDDRAATRRDAGKPFRAGASKHAHQHRLGLVVARVAGGDGVGRCTRADALEEGVARLASRLLDRLPVLLRETGDVGGFHVERHAELGGEIPAERGVPGGLGAAKAVVEMRDGDEAERASFRQLAQDPRERDRIGPPGDGRDNARAGFEQLTPSNARQDARGEGGHKCGPARCGSPAGPRSRAAGPALRAGKGPARRAAKIGAGAGT